MLRRVPGLLCQSLEYSHTGRLCQQLTFSTLQVRTDCSTCSSCLRLQELTMCSWSSTASQCRPLLRQACLSGQPMPAHSRFHTLPSRLQWRVRPNDLKSRRETSSETHCLGSLVAGKDSSHICLEAHLSSLGSDRQPSEFGSRWVFPRTR